MKRLPHVHSHTLDLDLGILKWEADWTRSHARTSGFVATTVAEKKDTISHAHFLMANQDRSLTERQTLLSGFEGPETGKNTPCPLASWKWTGPQLGNSVGKSVVQYAKVAGSIPDQGTYKKSTNRCINKWNNKSISLSLSLFLPPLSQINKIKNIEWTESPMQSRRPKSTAIYT